MLPRPVADALRSAPGQVLTTRQLRQIGVSRRWAAALADDGLLERVVYGVYRDPAGVIPSNQCLHIPVAYLAQRRPPEFPPELITSQAALAARKVPGFELPIAPLMLIDERRHVRRHRSLFDLRRTQLEGMEHDEIDGLRLALPSRAVADAALSVRLSDRRIRTAVDDLRHRRRLDIVEAAVDWAGIPHAGAHRMTAMVAAGVFEQESEGERDAFRLLFLDRHVLPDCQVWLTPSIRVDFVYLSSGLVIEYYGGLHDSTADEDATRIWALRALGFEVIVVTRSMLRDAPAVADQIQAVRSHRLQLIRDGRLRRPPVPVQPPRLTPLGTLLTTPLAA